MTGITAKVTRANNGVWAEPAVLTGSKNIADDTVGISIATGWPVDASDGPVHIKLFKVDANNALVEGSASDHKATLSGVTLANIEKTGGPDVDYVTGDPCIIYPTAGFWNDIADALLEEHDDLGKHTDITATTIETTGDITSAAEVEGATLKSTGDIQLRSVSVETMRSESEYDYIVPGGAVLAGTGYGSTLGWSLSAGAVYIGGRRYTVAAATGNVAATKDTYFDLLKPASGNVATLVYTGANSVTVNDPSPALAADSVRLGIIQSGANIASVAAVNQGQENKVLPIASSKPYAVTDSIGNLICPRDPKRTTIGYREILTDITTTSGTLVDVTGLDFNCIVPAGRKIEVVAHFGSGSDSVANNGGIIAIYDVTASAQIAEGRGAGNASGDLFMGTAIREFTPSASGVRNFKAQIARGSNAATFHTNGAATSPVFIRARLV